jgi:hypothetical protein
VQTAIRDSGADGSLHARPGDYLSIVDFNQSDSKLNPYVQQLAQYHVLVQPDLGLDATLTLRYHVSPSPADLEGTGPVFGFGGSKHDYEDYLRIFVPRGARLLGVTGAEKWAALPAYGLTQIGGRFIVREGQTRTVTFRYRIPANALAGPGPHRYRLYIRHQPGANLTAIGVGVTAGGGVRLGASGVTSVQRILPVGQDTALTIPLGGSLRPRVVPLPHTSGPIDPYLPVADLRQDKKHPF